MSRSVFRERARRRRRRRLLPLLCVLALAALAGVALSGGWLEGSVPERSTATASDRPPSVQTLVNGPPTAEIARRPLGVRLDATRDPVTVRFKHPPRSGLLFDLDTGEVLWRRHPERIVPIASLTKMMTALVVVHRQPADARVKVTKEALAYKGSGVGMLPRGKRIRLETMLYGLLLPSGNDAAIALAQRTSGTVAGFVRRMNDEARAMGLSCTRFSSPSGYVDEGNHSCAADLAAMAAAVLDEPRLAKIVRSRRARLAFPIKGGRLELYNSNPLLRTGYPGATGIKTGYTDAAGRCLVASATRNGRRIGVVLLHSPDPGTQARRLLNRAFRMS